MNTLTKSFWLTTTCVSLLLNVMLLCKSTLNLTTIIYTKSPEIFSNDQNQTENKGCLEEGETEQTLVDKAIDLKHMSKQMNWSFENHVGQPPSQKTYINTLKSKVSMIDLKENKEVKQKDQVVRVLCLVMTQPKNLRTRAQAVKDTWGKRCTKLLFISSKSDRVLPALGFDTPEGYEHLWLKTRAALKYIYENHVNDADWFFKGDDDTYLIMQNLKHFLSQHDSTKAHLFGRHIINTDGDFESGGAGYVFTRTVLHEFYEAMKNKTICKETSKFEDVEFAKCVINRGIHPKDAKDYLGRQIFHHYEKADDYRRSSQFSNATVSFHYIPANTMYEFEFMLYRMRNTENFNR